MGASFLSRSRSMVSLSSRRSSLVPTRRMGVWGQWCRTSGYHCGDGGSDPSPQRLLPEPALEQAGLPTVTGSTPGPSCFRVTARFGVGQEHPAGKLQGLSGPPSQGPCSPPPPPRPWQTLHQAEQALPLPAKDSLPGSGLQPRDPGQDQSPGHPPPSDRCPQGYPTLARTFSKEAGLTKEKQTRNTSWGGGTGGSVQGGLHAPPTPGLRGPPAGPGPPTV